MSSPMDSSDGSQFSAKKYLRILEEPGIDHMIMTPPIFFPCNSGQCRGGPNFECAEGYTGRLCSECKRGQFFFRGNCDLSCASIEPAGIVTLFGILAVVCVWLILNFIPSKSVPTAPGPIDWIVAGRSLGSVYCSDSPQELGCVSAGLPRSVLE